MALQVTGQAQGTLSASQKSGAPAAVNTGWHNELLKSDLLARYAYLGLNGNAFYAVNSAAQALSLSGTTTYTGLTVANPANSGKNLILLEAIWATTIAITGVGAMILATGAATAQTAGNSIGPLPTIIGAGASSVAKVGASCTYAANPTFLRPMLGISWVTAGTTQTLNNFKDEIAGALIVAPGQQVSTLAITTALTGIGYISWAELPL